MLFSRRRLPKSGWLRCRSRLLYGEGVAVDDDERVGGDQVALGAIGLLATRASEPMRVLTVLTALTLRVLVSRRGRCPFAAGARGGEVLIVVSRWLSAPNVLQRSMTSVGDVDQGVPLSRDRAGGGDANFTNSGVDALEEDVFGGRGGCRRRRW